MENDETNAGHLFPIGRRFDTLEELKHALSEYAIAEGFEYCSLRASDHRYEVKCRSEWCDWELKAHAVGHSNIYRIRHATLEHACFGIHHRGHRNAMSHFVLQTIRERLAESDRIREYFN